MSLSANEQSALNYLYSVKQLGKEICVGICAVLDVESSLNPLEENNTGTETPGSINPHGSYGVAQWNGPRQTALADFATKYDQDHSQQSTQLWFVLNEAATSYPKFWAAIQNTASGYSDVITAMVDEYERPANPTNEINKAIANAQRLDAEWHPTTTPMPVVATPIPSPVESPTPLPTPTQPPMGASKFLALMIDLIALFQKYGMTFN